MFTLQGNLSDVIIWDVPGKQDEVPFIPVQSPANHIELKNKNQSVDNEDADSDSKVSSIEPCAPINVHFRFHKVSISCWVLPHYIQPSLNIQI